MNYFSLLTIQVHVHIHVIMARKGVIHCVVQIINVVNIPNAPPISAPLVGILTLTIPQSDPRGL